MDKIEIVKIHLNSICFPIHTKRWMEAKNRLKEARTLLSSIEDPSIEIQVLTLRMHYLHKKLDSDYSFEDKFENVCNPLLHCLRLDLKVLEALSHEDPEKRQNAFLMINYEETGFVHFQIFAALAFEEYASYCTMDFERRLYLEKAYQSCLSIHFESLKDLVTEEWWNTALKNLSTSFIELHGFDSVLSMVSDPILQEAISMQKNGLSCEPPDFSILPPESGVYTYEEIEAYLEKELLE